MGSPKESCGPRESGGCTPGAVLPTLAQLLAGLGDPPVPQAPPPADCDHTAARGGEARAWPRRDHAKAGGVGVRQGGTALNALDSPAPALSPPSSPDSWGLCFLHPPGGVRSAPAAHVTRRLPPPRLGWSTRESPAGATTPFRGCGVGTASEGKPGEVRGDPPAGRLEGGSLFRTLGSQGELVTGDEVLAGQMSWAVRPRPRGRWPARLGQGS